MSANFESAERGRGDLPDPSTKGSGGLSDDAYAKILEQDAKEAVFSLEGDFAERNPLYDVAQGASFPGPVAEAFYWDDANICGIQGPVGSGKTTTLLKSRLRRAITRPRSVEDGIRRYKLVGVRQTYRDLWSTTIPSYLEVYPRAMGIWSGGRGDPVRHEIQFDDEFGRIEFSVEFKAFGDDIEGSMRGLQTTDMWLNEADTVPDDVITTGMGRISRYPARSHFKGLSRAAHSPGQMVCDFNAPDEENWTFNVFHNKEKREEVVKALTLALQSAEHKAAKEEKREPETVRPIGINFHNQPGYGEPGVENIQNLEPGYYETQIALNTLAGRGDKNARLVYNKVGYIRAGTPVFEKEFRRRIHVSAGTLQPDPKLPLMIGLDQGFKGAAVIAQMHGFFRWRILAELHLPKEHLKAVKFGLLLRDLLEDRFRNIRVEGGWGDMAGEHGSSLAEEENDTWNLMVGRSAGFYVRPSIIGQNRINPRLEAVRAALEAPLEEGEPGLLIDPSCKFLIAGFEARYVWIDDVTPTGDKRKIPNKKLTEANVMDSLQYLLLGQHTADGLSPYMSRLSDKRNHGRMGHNGGPSMSGGKPSGLAMQHDILKPYGGMKP